MALRRFHKRFVLGVISAALSVALVVLFTAPVFSDGGDPSLIHACVKKANGQVRIVQPSDTCLPSESSIHWAAGAPVNSAGSIMVHGAGLGTNYPGGPNVIILPAGGGVEVYRSPRGGVIQNMRLLITQNTFNGNTPVTLMVNGLPTSLTTVVPASDTNNINVSGMVTISDGDQISVVADRGASTGNGSLYLSVAYEIL